MQEYVIVRNHGSQKHNKQAKECATYQVSFWVPSKYDQAIKKGNNLETILIGKSKFATLRQ